MCHAKDSRCFLNLWAIDFISSGKCSTILSSNITLEIFLLSTSSVTPMVWILECLTVFAFFFFILSSLIWVFLSLNSVYGVLLQICFPVGCLFVCLFSPGVSNPLLDVKFAFENYFSNIFFLLLLLMYRYIIFKNFYLVSILIYCYIL